MPKFIVIEKRMITVEYEIEADSADDAKRLNGNILSETETDNMGYAIVSCNQISE